MDKVLVPLGLSVERCVLGDAVILLPYSLREPHRLLRFRTSSTRVTSDFSKRVRHFDRRLYCKKASITWVLGCST